MYTHLKERQYYENLYDKFTIETARRGMVHYDKFLSDFEAKLPKDEKLDKPGNAFIVNVFYVQTVGNELIHRCLLLMGPLDSFCMVSPRQYARALRLTDDHLPPAASWTLFQLTG